MDPPAVQYVTTSDGYSIAYAVSGAGTPFVMMPSVFDHIQLAWQYPGLHTWLERLSTRFHVIQFDPRGAGMSSRGLGEKHVLEDYQHDLEAVVERLGLERFVLYCTGPACAIEVQYAINHPERVIALVLVTAGGMLATFGKMAMFTVVPAEDWDLFLDTVAQRVTQTASDDGREPQAPGRILEMLKQAYGQQDFVFRMRSFSPSAAVEALLSRLITPVLVLHPRGYKPLLPEEAMQVARLASARMALIDGSDAFGDAEQGIRAIEAFLATIAPPTPTESQQRKDALSGREIEVLRLIAAGKSNQQIADQLVISFNTVQRHVGNILAKTGLTNRTEAAVYAHDRGLL
ncbi:MAG TPA: alpha/beta fold hydrolase [Dehalococcoidia bacterium]|nr:alpha/beta fold hydrolase [Dehalococcoidia bacterium]